MIKEDNLNFIKPAKFKMTDVSEKYLYGVEINETIDEEAKFKYFSFFNENYNVNSFANELIGSSEIFNISYAFNNESVIIVKNMERTYDASINKINNIEYSQNLEYIASFANLSKNFVENNNKLNTINFNSNLSNWLEQSDAIYNFTDGELNKNNVHLQKINLDSDNIEIFRCFDNFNNNNPKDINYTMKLLTKLCNKRFKMYEKSGSILTVPNYISDYASMLYPPDKAIYDTIFKPPRAVDNGFGNIHQVKVASNLLINTVYDYKEKHYLPNLSELENIENSDINTPLEIIIVMPVFIHYERKFKSNSSSYTTVYYKTKILIPIGVYKLYDKNDKEILLNPTLITSLKFKFASSKKFNIPVGGKVYLPFYDAVGTFNVFSTNNKDEFFKSIVNSNRTSSMFKNIDFKLKKFNYDNEYVKSQNVYTTPLTKYINDYNGYNIASNNGVYTYSENALEATSATIINNFSYLNENNNIIISREYSITFDKQIEFTDTPINYLFFNADDILLYIKFDNPVVSEYSFPITLKIRLDSGY